MQGEVLARYISHAHNLLSVPGLSPIIVLTHRSEGNFFKTEEQFKLLGAENIVIVENYTRGDHIKTRQRTADFLSFMKSALQNVTFRLEQNLSPRRDRVEHKKFLLKYIHRSVLDKKMEAERKEEKRRMSLWGGASVRT